MASDPELDLRGRLIRGLGSLREMLPGSFNPNTNLASATFQGASLVPSAQGAFATNTGIRTNMRQLQFALKYSF